MNKNMTIDASGIEVIKKCIHCRLKAFDDMQPNLTLYTKNQIKGKLRIGYGHYGNDVRLGMAINNDEAICILKNDLKPIEEKINYAINTDITQNMFNALVVHSYFNYENGIKDNVRWSIDAINNNNIMDAIRLLGNPTKINSVELGSLLKRRSLEKELFMTRMYLVPKKDKSISKTSHPLYISWVQLQLNKIDLDLDKLDITGVLDNKTLNHAAVLEKKHGYINNKPTCITKRCISILQMY